MILENDQYLTLLARSESIFKDRGSKFIGIAVPVFNEEQIKIELERIKNSYFDARHHCYAWTLGQERDLFRINDDGEPSGSAGRPIHGQILSQQMTNVLVVVVRYFGGTKLGVPGLINAYKTAAKEALLSGEKDIRTIYRKISISYPYEQMNSVMKIIKDNDVLIKNTVFEMSCLIEANLRLRDETAVVEMFHDKCEGVKIQLLDLEY